MGAMAVREGVEPDGATVTGPPVLLLKVTTEFCCALLTLALNVSGLGVTFRPVELPPFTLRLT